MVSGSRRQPGKRLSGSVQAWPVLRRRRDVGNDSRDSEQGGPELRRVPAREQQEEGGEARAIQWCLHIAAERHGGVEAHDVYQCRERVMFSFQDGLVGVG